MTDSQTPERERSFLEAGFLGTAVIGGILGGGVIAVALLLLAFGGDPFPLLGLSAIALAGSASCWFMSRLARW